MANTLETKVGDISKDSGAICSRGFQNPMLTLAKGMSLKSLIAVQQSQTSYQISRLVVQASRVL
jgi:hypothetical protein